MTLRCRIELFGGLRVRQPERTIERFNTQKTGALLAYLAYHPGQAHPREVLIDILWPDCDLPAGRNSLSVALSSLRHQLEPPGVPAGTMLAADRFTIQINPTGITTDVAEFEQALNEAESRGELERRESLARAIELYRGPLLPEYYEDWVLHEQRRWADRCFAAVCRLIGSLERSGDTEAAIEYARRAVGTDPTREEAHVELMRLLADSGRPAEALRQYRELEGILQETLGQRPSEQTARFVERLAQKPEEPPAQIEAAARHRPKSPRIAAPTLPTGTVTFLLAKNDAGESAQTDRALLVSAVRRSGGQIIEEADDSLAAAFGRSSDALACAASVLQNRAASPTSVPPCIALDTREVTLKAGRYPAATLVPAARLLSAAHPGQILCTEQTAGLLRRAADPGLKVVDLGLYRLNGQQTPDRLFSVELIGGVSDFPPPKADRVYTGFLPTPLTRFFGREEEVAQLTALLVTTDKETRRQGDKEKRPSPCLLFSPSPLLLSCAPHASRLVTLTGPGGIGKTRLSLEAAGHLLEPLRGSVWFVPLADLTDPMLIPDAILKALQISRSPKTEPLDQAAEALSGAPGLLVLDNFEQLVEEGAAVVRALLERAPSLTCLVTSRRTLNIEGERELSLSPLPIPLETDTPERLSRFASVQLFVDRAQTVRPDFQITPKNAADIAALCERLDGIPLAIELAAARAQVLTPSQMLAQLGQRFDFLVSRRRDISDRHGSLRAAMDWSYLLLTPELRQFFARLSVFRGGWTLEAAETVCRESIALDHLAELRECSLVVTEETGAEMRFRMPETAREYAAEQLAPEERPSIHRSHAEYFLAIAQEAETKLSGPDQAAWLERLTIEHDNLRAALAWAIEADKICAVRLASILCRFWHVRGYFREGREWTARVIEADGDAPPTLRAKLLIGAGVLAFRQGDYAAARSIFTDSLEISRQAADSRSIADALNQLGNVAQRLGDYSPAQGFYEESLERYRELGDSKGIANALTNLGLVAASRGDNSAALTLYTESLKMQRVVGDKRNIAGVLNNLGLVARALGEYAAARGHLEESLQLRQELGDKQGIADSLGNLGNVALDQEDYKASLALHEKSLALERELGDTQGIAGSLGNLGTVARMQGDYERSRALYEESLSIFRDMADNRGIADCLVDFALLAHMEGRLERAAWLWAASESLREAINSSLPRSTQVEYEERLAQARDALGENLFSLAWKKGRAMTREQAVTYALADAV